MSIMVTDTCFHCGAPATPRPGKALVLCENCNNKRLPQHGDPVSELAKQPERTDRPDVPNPPDSK